MRNPDLGVTFEFYSLILYGSFLHRGFTVSFLYYKVYAGENPAVTKKLFIAAVEFVAEFPLVGKKSNIENVRMKVVRDYLIIYEFNDEYIYVLRVWSTQQNPESIKDIVG